VGVASFVAIGLVAGPMMAQGQERRERPRAETRSSAIEPSFGEGVDVRTFGLVSAVSHTVSGLYFTGFEMSFPDNWDTNESGSRGCAVADCILVAPLRLPAGALVTSIQVDVCDTSATSDATVSLRANPLHEATPIVLATAATSGTPGCGFVSAALATPHTVDNGTNTYSLRYTGAPDLSTRVQAVRVFYNLQVSPAPAVATFGDVPTTHAFFRFVEAMAASGITQGCGAGNFCPDLAVTRGQIAAFLSKALGLHFAP
jgi:hypothetical protein